MKKTVLIGASIIGALLLAVLVVPSFFNWNTQKTRLETAASQALGQPVAITGDIALALLPSPRLKAEGLSVGARGTLEDGPYISAGLVDVRVALWPLFSGNIEAGRVVLRDADIVVLTGQDSPASASPELAATPESASPSITLPAVEIDNAKITLINAQTKAQTTVSQIDLLIAANSVSGPFSIEGGLQYKQVPLKISVQTGDIEEDDFPFEFELFATGDTAFSIKAVGSAGAVLSERPRLEGRLNVQAEDLGHVLNGFYDSAEPALNGTPLAMKAPLTLEDNALRIDGMQITLGQTQLRSSAQAMLGGAVPKASIQLFADKIDLADFTDPKAESTNAFTPIEITLPTGVDLTLEAAVDTLTGLPVSIDRLLVASQLNNGRLEITRASMLLPGGVTALVNGTYQTRNGLLTGTTRAGLKGANADALLQAALGKGAARPPAPTALDVSVDAALEPTGLRIGALIGALGDMRINGTGKLGYSEAPAISIQASINEINLDDWIDPEAQTKAAQKEQSAPFAGQLDLDLSVERLRRADQVFQGLSLKGQIKGGTLALQSARLGKRGDAFAEVTGQITDIDAQAPRLQLSYVAQAANANSLLTLAGAEPAAQLGKAGALAIEGKISGTTDAPKVNAAGTLGALEINSSLTLEGLNGPAPTTQGSATLRAASPAALLAQLELLDKASVLDSAQPMTLVASFSASDGTAQAQADLRNAAGLAKLTYSQNGAQYEVDLGASAPSLTQYLRAAGIAFDPAGATLGGLDLSAQMSGPLEALTLSALTANIGPAKLSGTGLLNLSGETSIVDLRLTGKNLDLAEILPPAETGAQQAAAGTGQRWSKEPLDLSVLNAIDGAVTLDLDRLTLRGYELKNARLSLGSEGKRLRVGLDKGELFDGPATLSVALDGRQTPRLDIQMAIKGGDISKATQSSAAIAPLTGTFDLEGTFAGAGNSEYEIVKSLAGTASFSVRDGLINGINIPQINDRFGALNTVNDFLLVLGSALQRGQTAYRLIAVDAVAKNGILTTQNMRTDIDGGAQAALDSAINLPEWTITANGSFALEDHPEAPPVGVAITGPLDHSIVAYETKKLQGYLGVRLGAAVIKGVIAGDGNGFNLGTFLNGGRTPEAETSETTPDEGTQNSNWSDPSQPQEDETPSPAKPEEKIRDLILKGLFGRKN